MFSEVWSENAALFERLIVIQSNPPILYYGFKQGQFALDSRFYLLTGVNIKHKDYIFNTKASIKLLITNLF